MTDTTAHEGYERIEWADVREGDVLMHENGDRLTVKDVTDKNIRAVTGYRSAMLWGDFGFSPYRRQPEMPTEPGAYLDKDGDCWLLDRSGNWYDWSLLYEPTFKSGSPQPYAPFTRLVPMPTEEQVYEAIDLATSDRVIGEVQPAAAAVMALLAGEGGGDDEC